MTRSDHELQMALKRMLLKRILIVQVPYYYLYFMKHPFKF